MKRRLQENCRSKLQSYDRSKVPVLTQIYKKIMGSVIIVGSNYALPASCIYDEGAM